MLFSTKTSNAQIFNTTKTKEGGTQGKKKKKELSSTYTIKALTKYSHKSIKLKPIEQF